jgi:tRNA G26 N,N-dimethylase Trm1
MDVFINLQTPMEEVEEIIKKLRANGYKAFVDWNVYVIRTDAPVVFIEKLKKYHKGIQSYSVIRGKRENNRTKQSRKAV